MQQRIVALADEGHEGKAIYAELVRLGRLRDEAINAGSEDGAPWGEYDVPDVRTIQRAVADLRPRDQRGEWRLADATGEEAALVLPVLAAVFEKTEGRRMHISVGEAEWIVRLMTAAPDLPPWEAYQLTRAYIRASETESSTDLLDRWFAFAPWRDNAERWRKFLPYEDHFRKAWAEVRGSLATTPADPRQAARLLVEALHRQGFAGALARFDETGQLARAAAVVVMQDDEAERAMAEDWASDNPEEAARASAEAQREVFGEDDF